MNWITKIITAAEKIKTAVRKRATKSEIAASKYISCHGVPTEKKIIEVIWFSICQKDIVENHLKIQVLAKNQN